MTTLGIGQLLFYLLILFLLVKPLGCYMAAVYADEPCGLNTILRPFERFLYRCCLINAEQEMNWRTYLYAMLAFNFLSLLFVYLILRLQAYLPLNPQHFPNVPPELSLNIAVSFSSNSNWQAYAGEKSLSYFTQMIALAVQNFASPASGMALMIALIRGFSRTQTENLGNFWVDLIRSILYILLPLSLIFAVILCSQGVIQNFNPYKTIHPLQSLSEGPVFANSTNGQPNTNVQKTAIQQSSLIPGGPVASQVAIKQLGTNGGGFFNSNSSHPFENPTPLTNFLEMLAILLIPAALCYTFGVMIKDKTQGWAILSAMLILFIPAVFLVIAEEQKGNPAFQPLRIEQTPKDNLSSGGNMEGKEVRFGIINSAIWATATTAASNGSVNAMHDSFTPLGGLALLWMMHLGEVAFGGVGSGLYGMLMLVIISVFVAGLMVGRSPEYLGKKIEVFEMKMAALVVLIMPLIVLIFTAIACLTPVALRATANPGAHAFSEILYAFTSMGNNNGSAFAGLNANTAFYNICGSIAMLISRYWIAIPILAIAGSIASKKIVPTGSGTLPTNSILFIILLVAITIVLGALSFLPALALGPIVEHLLLWSRYGH
nr:potassium-transporting ATPase subunit KdpA [Legionella jordanis]